MSSLQRIENPQFDQTHPGDVPAVHPFASVTSEIPALEKYWVRILQLRAENPNREIPPDLETGLLFLASFVEHPDHLAQVADAYGMNHETAKEIVYEMYDSQHKSLVDEFYKPLEKEEQEDGVVDQQTIFEDEQIRIDRIFRESIAKAVEVLTPFEKQIYDAVETGMTYQDIAQAYDISPANFVATIYRKALTKIEQQLLRPAGLNPIRSFRYTFKGKEITVGRRLVPAAMRGELASVKFGGHWLTADDIAERYAREHIRIVDEELLAQDYMLLEDVRRQFPHEFHQISYRYYNRGEKNLIREEQNVLYVSRKTLRGVQKEQLPRRWNPSTFKPPEPGLKWIPDITDDENERERLRHALKKHKIRGVKTEKGWWFVDPKLAKAYLATTKPRSKSLEQPKGL